MRRRRRSHLGQRTGLRRLRRPDGLLGGQRQLHQHLRLGRVDRDHPRTRERRVRLHTTTSGHPSWPPEVSYPGSNSLTVTTLGHLHHRPGRGGRRRGLGHGRDRQLRGRRRGDEPQLPGAAHGRGATHLRGRLQRFRGSGWASGSPTAGRAAISPSPPRFGQIRTTGPPEESTTALRTSTARWRRGRGQCDLPDVPCGHRRDEHAHVYRR